MIVYLCDANKLTYKQNLKCLSIFSHSPHLFCSWWLSVKFCDGGRSLTTVKSAEKKDENKVIKKLTNLENKSFNAICFSFHIEDPITECLLS